MILYLVNNNIEFCDVKCISFVRIKQTMFISEVVKNMMECSFKNLFKRYDIDATRWIKNIKNVQDEQQDIGLKIEDKKIKYGMAFDGIKTSRRMRLN